MPVCVSDISGTELHELIVVLGVSVFFPGFAGFSEYVTVVGYVCCES